MRRLLLVRHGLTDHTGKLLSGWLPAIQLNDQGQAQVAALGQRLAEAHLDTVYSSPLERCVQTAEALASPHGLAVRVDEDFGEAHYGDWTGQSLSSVKQSDLWSVLERQPSAVRFPGGESLYELQTRSVLACERLAREHSGEVVVVCAHGDVIRAILAHYLGLHLDLYDRIAISPASLSIIGFDPLARVLRLNDCTDPGALTALLARPPSVSTTAGATAEQDKEQGEPWVSEQDPHETSTDTPLAPPPEDAAEDNARDDNLEGNVGGKNTTGDPTLNASEGESR